MRFSAAHQSLPLLWRDLSPQAASCSQPFVAERIQCLLAPNRVVLRKVAFRPFAEQHCRQQACELNGVMNAAIQTETADRIVHMGGIACQKYSAFLKTCCHTLMNAVNIAVKNFVPP